MEEVRTIRETGRLIAANPYWQYWIVNQTMYSVSTDGRNYNVWCGIQSLGKHLHRLYQITGKRFFTESDEMDILDSKFLSDYPYA